MFYLDDISFGVDVNNVLRDLAVIEREPAKLGLLLNHCKSEVICSDMSTRNSIQSSFSGASMVEPSEACLLGFSIDNLDCVLFVISDTPLSTQSSYTPSEHLHVSSLHLVSRVMMMILDPSLRPFHIRDS